MCEPAYAQPDQSLCYSLEYSMNIKQLTEHTLEFLCLKGGCTGSSESIHVKLLEITCRGRLHNIREITITEFQSYYQFELV